MNLFLAYDATSNTRERAKCQIFDRRFCVSSRRVKMQKRFSCDSLVSIMTVLDDSQSSPKSPARNKTSELRSFVTKNRSQRGANRADIFSDLDRRALFTASLSVSFKISSAASYRAYPTTDKRGSTDIIFRFSSK